MLRPEIVSLFRRFPDWREIDGLPGIVGGGIVGGGDACLEAREGEFIEKGMGDGLVFRMNCRGSPARSRR